MWCIKQVGYEYYINDTDNWHLDKDILGDENDRMYSANNCVLVPNELNVMAQTKKEINMVKVFNTYRRERSLIVHILILMVNL